MGIEAKHIYRFVYLKSRQWETGRLDALVREKGRCQVCGDEDTGNDGHHLWYPESFWDTTSEQIIVLCRPCHEFIHAFLPKNNRREPAESDWDKLIKGLKIWRLAKLKFLEAHDETLALSPKSLRDAFKRSQKELHEAREKLLVIEEREVGKPVLSQDKLSQLRKHLRDVLELTDNP